MTKLHRASDIYFEKVLNNSSDIIICISSDFIIEYFNPIAEQYFNIEAKSAVDSNFFKLFEQYNLSSPIENNYENIDFSINILYENLNNTKKKYELEWKIISIDSKDLNSAIMMIATPHVCVEHNIVENLSQIVNVTPGSLYWKDLNGKYLGCNMFMVKTAGLNSPDDIIGKTDFDLWPENAQKIYENDQQVIQANKAEFLHETVQISNGETMYFTGVKMPLKDPDNNVIGIIGNSLDITNLEKAKIELKLEKEKAEMAAQAKEQFIQNMSHDIRTPFSGILQLAEHMLEQEDDPEKKMELNLIVESSNRVFNLLTKIMDSVKSTDIENEKKHFSLKDILDDIVSMLDALVKQKGIELIIDFSSKLPQDLVGDFVRLNSVLLNLISNAVKFTDQGYVKVTVKPVKQTAQTVTINLIVEDSGIGIPKNKQEFIFEKFSRLVPSYKGLYNGIGFGLYIVKQFVEEMEGKISLSSREGEGSTFSCTLDFSYN